MAVLVIVFHKIYGRLSRILARYRKQQGHKVHRIRYNRRLNIKRKVSKKNADYLVIMGSIEQVPSIMRKIHEGWVKTALNQKVNKAASDISYGVVDGVLKTIVGRLTPGDNVYGGSKRELNKRQMKQNVRKQIQKIKKFENSGVNRDVFRVAGIGSNEGNGFGIDGMSDKVFLHSELEKMYNNEGIIYNEFYDGNAVGGSAGVDDGVVLDSAGRPSDRKIVDLMNRDDGGIKGLFYTGHANEVSLSTSGFDVHDSNKLKKRKDGKNLFIGCAVGCSVGSHDENYMSLCEALQCCKLSGSVAFFGSTILQSWAPPMYMQREIMRSFGTVKTIGELFRKGIEVENFRTADDFWFYTLFGDPLTKVSHQNQ